MTNQVVIFPDASEVVVRFLDAQLTVPVRTRVPNPRPSEFVRVLRTGGVRVNQVADDAQITIEGWAATEQAAHDLAQLCRGLVHTMRGTSQSGVPVYRVNEIGGPVNLPDPESAQTRYTFTVSIAMRGRAA